MSLLPYQSHSPTSAEAAERAEPRAGTDQALILAALRFAGDYGGTDEEMQNALGMNPSTQRPRRIELVSVGLVVDSGETRKTRSGRRAVVWRAVPVPCRHGNCGCVPGGHVCAKVFCPSCGGAS